MKKDQFLKFYDKFKLYIFPIIVFLLSMLLIVLVIYPQITKFLENQEQAKQLEEKSRILESKAKELENYDPKDLSLKVNSALSSYPADRDYVNVLRILQTIVAQSQFGVASMSLAGGSGDVGVKAQSYNMKLDVIGPITNLPKLLSNIENSYRLMRVVSLETSAGKDLLTNASLTISVLFADAPKDFGSADSPLPKFSDKEQEILSRLAAIGDIVVSQDQQGSQLGSRGKTNPFE